MVDTIDVAIDVLPDVDVAISTTDEVDVEIDIPQGASFTNAKVFKSAGIILVEELGSGESFDIPKHKILLPDGSIHQSDEFDEDFQLPIIYNFPPPSGADVIYRTGDELDIWQTVFLNGVLPSVGQRVLADPNNFTKLLTKNAFDNLEKFTNDLGGSTYDGSGGETVDYTVNHYNGIGYLIKNQRDISGGIGDANWNDNIDNALAWVQGPYSDFFLPYFDALTDIAKRGTGTAFNYAPFSVSTNLQYWTSTTAISPTTEAYVVNRLGVVSDNGKGVTSSRNAFYCRKHF